MSISSGKFSLPIKLSFSSSSVFITASISAFASANSLVSLNLLSSSSYSFRAVVFRASVSTNSNSVFSLATFAAIAVFLVSLDEEATDDPFDFWLCESRLERLEFRERPLPVSCLISIILSLIFRNVSECSRSKISNFIVASFLAS